MDEGIPPAVGAAGAALVVAVAVVPYLALPGAEASGLSTYYGYGLVGPWGVSLFSVVAAVAFLGGRRGRTDPELVAGVTLVVGAAGALLAVEWALAVDPTVLQSITTAAWLSTHRWAFAGLSLLVPAAGAWYARAIGVV